MAFKFGGYTGKYLRVDLTTGKIIDVPLPEEMARDFLGGNGFGTKILGMKWARMWTHSHQRTD